MRDPKRIKPLLKLVEHIWMRYPDLRLLQLLLNISPFDRNMYNIEDEELMANLEALYGRKNLSDKKTK